MSVCFACHATGLDAVQRLEQKKSFPIHATGLDAVQRLEQRKELRLTLSQMQITKSLICHSLQLLDYK